MDGLLRSAHKISNQLDDMLGIWSRFRIDSQQNAKQIERECECERVSAIAKEAGVNERNEPINSIVANGMK